MNDPEYYVRLFDDLTVHLSGLKAAMLASSDDPNTQYVWACGVEQIGEYIHELCELAEHANDEFPRD